MDKLHKIYFYWTEGHLMDIHGLERLTRKQPQDPTMYGLICGSICLMQRKAKRSKSGLSWNRSSIMPEDYVVSSSLNQMMKYSNTPLKTLLESWKFRCQQHCLCRGETCRNLGKRKTKIAGIVDADESMRILLEGVQHMYHEDHISAKGKMHWAMTIWCLKHWCLNSYMLSTMTRPCTLYNSAKLLSDRQCAMYEHSCFQYTVLIKCSICSYPRWCAHSAVTQKTIHVILWHTVMLFHPGSVKWFTVVAWWLVT